MLSLLTYVLLTAGVSAVACGSAVLCCRFYIVAGVSAVVDLPTLFLVFPPSVLTFLIFLASLLLLLLAALGL